MPVVSKYFVFACMIAFSLAVSGFSQNASQALRVKVDAVIADAYKQASAKFPCKLGTAGKAKMGNWKNVENCVNPAHDLVDWESLAAEIQKIRDQGRYASEDMVSTIEASLTAQAISYDKVFTVKQEKALLPLSNSLLKFLPSNSLAGLPVYDREGSLLGTFSGPYASEKSGRSETVKSYRMVSFQYTDLKGNMQAPTDTFLVDSFGVPWKDAKSQTGFRLPPDRFFPKHW
jgi:hypothetical protein